MIHWRKTGAMDRSPVSNNQSADRRDSWFAGRRGFQWARRLPTPIKHRLLSCFWPLKALVEDFQDYTAELVGVLPSHGLRMLWYRYVCRVKVGQYSSIHRMCRMYHPYRITIGEHSIVNYGVRLDGRRGLTIGDNVSISEGTIILTLGHDIDDPDFIPQGAPVVIKDYVFIGACACILPGVTIGHGAVVAAAAVVTSDVEPYTVVAGVPARPIRERSRDLRYVLEHQKRFG